MERQRQRYDSVEACVDAVLERVGKRIVLGLPLGIGKANHFANALYARAAADSSISLTIFTALTLERPVGKGEIQRRFIQPLLDRLYNHYQDLAYTAPRHRGQLPPNIEVCEFFMQPGAYLHNPTAQQAYVSANYTHVTRDLFDRGVNLIAQMVAPGDSRESFSLSSNPDLTLPILREAQAREGYELYLLGEVNPQLPYLGSDAILPAERFDFLLEGDMYDTPLFCAPTTPVGLTEYSIGMHVASLLPDGGSLQVGIGALGDAVCHALRLRHTHNKEFGGILRDLTVDDSLEFRHRMPPQQDKFERGLYGVSEMVPPGFLNLRRAGVLKREVYPDEALQGLLNRGEVEPVADEKLLLALKESGRISCPLTEEDTDFLQSIGAVDPSYSWRGHRFLSPDGEQEEADLHSAHGRQRLLGSCAGKKLRGGIWLHGGFYLGPSAMYRELRQLDDEEWAGINMTAIDYINELQHDYSLKVAQRQQARFVNAAMMVTLNGAVISDGLADAQVVSGVGGQYNFVAQAHELPGGRSVITLPSTRESGGETRSNIVWEFPHCTIPRHLRDIVVTEYGVADLRGRSDRDVIVAMLAICDSRFQEELLEKAKSAGKVEQDYSIPLQFTENTPAHIRAVYSTDERLALLPYYPLGTDFTEEEALLAAALGRLKVHSKKWWKVLPLALAGYRAYRDRSASADYIHRCLERMGFEETDTFEHKLEGYLVAGALREFVDLRRPLTGPGAE
ncbi:acetyl-CoA hydrolase/transferase C-terminal domain-containing protein [Microbulbifer yueqingensis]|uniref:Acetyl-CoA hydrolase/transferase C-terminal domain-containing protein n=1 Tax=Microbulbifer yueqingensis TaxID=658219 RepID=A0A1G8ZNV7_9GAMM|nr:acetyl-CoA hydrolase/transferase C-terminal domain-containing protein [Microbulbifer yueqingensis]SDK16776.1 Acetyl-CoA hydrolase/transferase C-terminal domain-containing protein [Microbulbifer yueqingensis]